MFKTKYIFIMLMICGLAFASCSDDESSVAPVFGGITIGGMLHGGFRIRK